MTSSQQTLTGLTDPLTTFFVTVSDGCSPDEIVQLDVIVYPVPDITFTVDGEGCAPSVFTADTATQTGIPPVTIISWLWYFGDGATSTDPFFTSHEYLTADTFDVSLVVISIDGCKDSISMPGAAIAYGPPTAEFTLNQNGSELLPPETTILSPTVDFVDSSTTNVSIWVWDFGDPNSGADNNSWDQNPSHMYTDTGTYTITLIVFTADSCSDTITHELTVTGEYILFAPNAFTPGGGDENDYFFPKGIGVDGQSFELYIFDRWGDLIATVKGVWSDDPEIGWDGRANKGNSEAQIDVYVWLIRTDDFKGVSHEYVGHVTLLR